jgi:hypothetical protein
VLRHQGRDRGQDARHDPRLRCGGRVDAVGLHECGVRGHVGEGKGAELRAAGGRRVREGATERRRVAGAVVGRNFHGQYEYAAARSPREFGHARQVVAQLRDRVAAQAVVTAELDDQQVGLVFRQQSRQAPESSAGRVAADRGIDQARVGPALAQARLQQCHPALLEGQAVGGADTIAEHQDARRAVAAAGAGAAENEAGEECDRRKQARAPVPARRSDSAVAAYSQRHGSGNDYGA